MARAATAGGDRDYLKWAFFGLAAACTLLVIWVDERFLVVPSDPEWRHIARFKWWLLPHGLAGAVALLAGPLQFSDTIRRRLPRLHRWTGRLYVAAICCVAAPIGMYVGANLEPRTILVEQYFQAGLWWLTTAIAFVCILNRQIERHKIWMMRSYGFCLVFVLSRVPDAFVHTNDQQLADMLWSLVVAALVGPDLMLTARELIRKRSSKRPAAKPATAAAAAAAAA
jgi:hypothetical protein